MKDVFSDGLIPPANLGFSSVVITSDQHLNWPYNYAGTSLVTSKIMDVSCSPGNLIYLPPTNEVSPGESILLRNVGANPLGVLDSNGVSIISLSPGIAQFLWVTEVNTWNQITYGAGTSAVSSGALAGFGTKATGATLSVAAPTLSTASTLALTTSHRGQSIEFTGGVASLTMSSAATYGNDFYCFVKNSGSGVVTITPSSGLVDGQSTLALQPGESLILMCTGSVDWYSVGYGRSILYQFSQLVLDVSAGGTITLTSTQASNKMLTFVGNPAAGVNVVVPSVVSVYYVANNLSTNQSVQVKVAATPGVLVSQSQRAVLLCDGSSVSSAQSATVTTVVSMLDGSVVSPSLNYATQPNTGFYKFSTQGLGLSVASVAQLTSNGSGVEFPLGLTYLGVKFKTSNTGSLVMPAGTTAQRDGAPGSGYTRFNSDLGKNEYWNGTAWVMGGGATGGGSDDAFYENAQTVTTNYAITTNKNAMSAGPITINSGVSVTIPSGSTWSII